MFITCNILECIFLSFHQGDLNLVLLLLFFFFVFCFCFFCFCFLKKKNTWMVYIANYNSLLKIISPGWRRVWRRKG